jgi:flagellar hook-basal body complex protein FliE
VSLPIRLDRAATPFLDPARALPKLDATGGDFGDVLRRTLGDTSQIQDEARSTIEAFLRGEPVDLHQVMAASEEASIALELLVEMRNKLTDAYRTLMNMS